MLHSQSYAGQPTVLLRPIPRALILLVAAILARRVFTMPVELDRDVGLYALQAREWLRGGWPYVAVWDIHSIGEPALATLVFAVLGEGVAPLRLLGAAAVATSGFIIARIVSGASGGTTPDGSRALGLAAGLAYVAYTTLSGGLAANNEVVLAPFVIAAVARMIGAARRLLDGGAIRVWDVLAPGLLFGVALWIKQVAAPEACAAFAGLIALAVWQGRLRVPGIMAYAAVFGLACAAPTLLTALVYAVQGEFAALYNATIEGPLRYGAGGRALSLVPGETAKAAVRFAPLILLAAVGSYAAFRRLRATLAFRSPEPIAATLWLAAAIPGVLMPPTPYGHHFLILLPPLSVLAGFGAGHLMTHRPGGWRRSAGIALVLALFVASGPLASAVTRIRADSQTDVFAEAGSLLRAGLEPGRPIYVVNANPVLYVLAGAPIPTRYVFPDHLAGQNANTVPGLDADAEMARVLALRPQYLVLDRDNWDGMRDSAKAMLSAAMAVDYKPVATLSGSAGVIEIYRNRL